MSIRLTELCFRLSHDVDSRVRLIGQQCLRSYDEFHGLRYANLSARDAQHITAVADAARAGDANRAQFLDEAAGVVRSYLPN